MLTIDDPTLARVFAPRTAIAPDGTVEGYASLFGEIDQARDMVMAGAFRQSLMLRGPRRIPMLFQHDPAEPIGIWLELIEDLARALCARPAHPRRAARPRGAGAGQGRRDRRAVDRLQDSAGTRRAAHTHSQDRAARPLGNFDRHVSAADRRARARRQGCGRGHERRGRPARAAIPPPPALLVRAHAGRSGVEDDLACAAAENEDAAGASRVCAPCQTGGTRLERVQHRRQAPPRGAIAASAAGSPTARCARWPTARRRWRVLRAEPRFVPRTDRDTARCFKTNRNGSRTSASAGCGPTPSAGCGQTRIGG